MKPIHNIDRMESQLNNQRLKEISSRKAKLQREKWRDRERIINMIISGRRHQCIKSGQTLVLEG